MGAELSDLHINLAQKFLKEQFNLILAEFEPC